MADPSIERFRRVVEVAHRHLTERQAEINSLNVIPVPDGDTGDNMVGTMGAVVDALQDLTRSTLAQIDRELIVTTVDHAALMGARGNSGVILSQVISGASRVLTTRRGELIGPRLIRDALQQAAEAARGAVHEPEPGTVLTVLDALADAVSNRADALGRDVEPGMSDAEQNALLGALIGPVLPAGIEALERTQQQNERLAEAGVVDAGAYGLMVILGGLLMGLAGVHDQPSPIPHYPPAHIDPHWDSQYSHCTSCIVTGRELDPGLIAPRLDGLGDSVAVVGDQTMLKVHVHTDEPARVQEICSEFGNVDQFEATNMHEQIAERRAEEAARMPVTAANHEARTGLVAVASGVGIAGLFAAEGATVLDGGATLNPSINEILEAIRQTPGEKVLVLPNSSNVVMAAEEAVRLAEKPAAVVPSTSLQAGLAAVVGGFDPSGDPDENARRISAELEAISTGLVAEADRDDPEGRYRRGEAVGLLGSRLVAWGDPGQTLSQLVARLGEDAEIITILEGADPPVRAGELAMDLSNGAELEIRDGGQPTYWWLIAAQ
jgi:uncharacterized protein